ncbi:class I SAM-dependent methyltransferase [Kitasatospora sp. NPDC101183]|uniref:class I SAM-dependent methyltransferase n=1 Tax=Kitasatospora sp. NPDC101183 TaxID=3364100 RepID=UPI0038294B85
MVDEDRVFVPESGGEGVPLFEARDLPQDEESLLDERFHDAEAPIYQSYCDIPRTRISERWLLDWILDRTPRGVVLDLGSGTGRVAAHLASPARRVIAVDRSHGMLEFARGSLPDRHAVALRADVRHLPIRDASVDAVICSGVLHHLPDWRGALAEAARVLAPGGTLIVREPNASYAAGLFEPLEKLMGLVAQPRCPGTEASDPDDREGREGLSPVEQPMDPTELLEAARSSGFSTRFVGSAMFFGSLGIPGESPTQELYFRPANLLDRLVLNVRPHLRGALLLTVLARQER